MSGLRVALTGPTGDVGRSLLRALERAEGVTQVVAMGRRPFDPAELGLTKVEYHRGDVLDRVAVDELVQGVDVVVHLALLSVGERAETERTNLDGSRTVFTAAAEAGATRIVCVTCHGHPLDATTLSATLGEIAGDGTDAYVLRPCIVAGPDALGMIRNIPYIQLFELLRRYQNPLTAMLLAAIERYPNVNPVLPDPGTRFQLVDHDDVAEALLAAVMGRGTPGVYDIAAAGEITISDLAAELGWRSVPVPAFAFDRAAEVADRLPLVPAQTRWIETLRQSVVMDAAKARLELGWEPQHDAQQVLRETVEAARRQRLLEFG